jgi:hypothetical protein
MVEIKLKTRNSWCCAVLQRKGNLRNAAASLGYTADQGRWRIRMVGGDDVWHARVSKTHWQPARGVAHARSGGVSVYGSPESLGIAVLGSSPCMKGSIGGRGVRYATVDCKSQEPGAALDCTNSAFVGAAKLQARERKRPLPRCCGHREVPCCGGGEAMGCRG